MLLLPLGLWAQEVGTPARILSPGDIYFGYRFSPEDEAGITKEVGKEEFDRIDAACRESEWPSAISTVDGLLSNMGRVRSYKAYFVCRFDNGNKVVLRVPKGENSSRSYQYKPDETFFFIIKSSGVDISTDITHEKASGEPIVHSFGDLYATYVFRKADLITLADYVPEQDIADITDFAVEQCWPVGINSFKQREANRSLIYNYAVELLCFLDGEKVLLKVPADKNKHMKGALQLNHDIYFVLDETAIDINGSKLPPRIASLENMGSGESDSQSMKMGSKPKNGRRVSVSDFSELYSTYQFTPEDEAIIIDAIGANQLDTVKTNSNEKAWPTGISTFSDRQLNRSRMYNYHVELVCYIGEKALIKAPANKNQEVGEGLNLEHDIYFVVGKNVVELK